MRNIPEDNLAYSVLIKLSNGSSGSGFQLNSGSHIYLVTAKHVLVDKNGMLNADKGELVCQTADINDESTAVYEIDFRILQNSQNIFFHAEKDVAAFMIGTLDMNSETNVFTLTTTPGVTGKQEGNTPQVTVSKQTVAFMENVLVSNDIFLYGYPSSLGLKQSPQFDYYKPLLRKGIVASINKSKGTIILDCPVYPGNSGGPVVQVKHVGKVIKHDVIGVVSEFIPYTEQWLNLSNKLTHIELSNSGYSVAVAMDYVFEMLSIKID